MSNLIIIDGISGVWKDDLETYVCEKLANSTIIKKYSDRTLRSGEDEAKIDLHLLDSDAFNKSKFDYEYTFNGHKYGILKEDIVKMKSKSNAFIIVRNHDIICKLQSDFSEMFNVVTLFVYVGLELVLPKYNLWYGDEGKKNLHDALIDYYRHPNLYEHILIYSERKSDFYRLLDNVVSQSDSVVDDFIFVVMSMADVSGKHNRKSRFVRSLYNTIRDSFARYRLNAFRVDSADINRFVPSLQNSALNTIDNKILGCIQKAKLVVVDLSYPRPNCYFELGYALALNKKVVLVAYKNSEIHFDIEHHNIFKYNNLNELSDYLKNVACAMSKTN